MHDARGSRTRSAIAFLLQDWSANSSLYARLLLVSFRLGCVSERTQTRRGRLLTKLAYRIAELWFGRILGQAQLDPRARVGPRLRLPHGGNGIVLNASAELGADVVIFQQVTVGTDPYARGEYRSAQIGDRVVISAGAKIIGNVSVGHDAVVGANAVVIDDVPPHATAVGVPARTIERDAPRVTHPASDM